ncbi:hypothetical protein L7F22_000590 [Adiantum nelumboides]|nr:hypothetical protein [Adiantum nelumboides]
MQNVNLITDLWLDEMFCQSEAYAGQSSHHSVPQLRQSSSHERILQKQKSFDLHTKLPYVHEYPEQQITQEDEDGKAKKYEDNENTIHFLKGQRHQLERDVLGLQGKLQQEVDLHYALENAFRPEAGGLSGLCNLPAHAKKLVSEVAMLEVAISSLEEQIASLNFQLGYEQRHRQLVEGTLGKLPFQGQEGQTREPHYDQSFSKPTLYCVSPNALPSVESPRLFNIASPCKNTYIHNPVGNFSSPVKQESIQDLFSGVATVPHRDSLVQHAKVGYKNFWKQSGFFSPEKVQTLLVLMY